MDKGERLFSNLSKSKRKRIKIISGMAISFGIVGIALSFIAFIVNDGISIMSIQGLLFGSTGGFFGLIAWSREFCVYEKGIQIPTSFWKKFYTFKEIDYVDMNMGAKEANWQIEIKPIKGEKHTYKKENIVDWDEFVELSEDFLEKRVEIRGLRNQVDTSTIEEENYRCVKKK